MIIKKIEDRRGKERRVHVPIDKQINKKKKMERTILYELRVK